MTRVEDVIRVHDEYYIRAASSLADARTLVLKHDDLFAVFDRYGDIHPIGRGRQGLYWRGTRHLNRLELRLGPGRPVLLDSAVTRDNGLLVADLTNPDILEGGKVVLPAEALHVQRVECLRDAVAYQTFRVRNFSGARVELELAVGYAADFADIFEVRGMRRARRGTLREPARSGSGVTLRYVGLDGVERRTRIELGRPPDDWSSDSARYRLSLAPRESWEVELSAACELGEERRRPAAFKEASGRNDRDLREARGRACDIMTSNAPMNDWLEASSADLHSLTSRLESGPYPCAGIPWYSVPFGRDGIITALECLWADPDLARGVLRYLAATQAKEADPQRDAEPGKIVHEVRGGEMAALGEVPFARYYGSVDATPLFVVLAGAYHRRTGDMELLRELRPSVEAALDWIERRGDRDGDGFVEYSKASEKGLVQQGWKDSGDSVFHGDGRLAAPPIALCEVQGYVYAAHLAASELFAALGDAERAGRSAELARTLRQRFDESFWCERLGMYALALDGEKRPCRVRTSNAGQCLFTGIASPERAAAVARRLFGEDMFSGWGVRTVSSDEARYNPMSYHNGSVWPHDNALIALGLARCGAKDKALALFESFLQASLAVEGRRLPELFCGFPRRKASGPVPYPVACAPQAWASGSVFLFLQAALGLSIDAPAGRVEFAEPALPAFLHRVRLRGLKVGRRSCDLLVTRQEGQVSVRTLRKDEGLAVVIRQ